MFIQAGEEGRKTSPHLYFRVYWLQHTAAMFGICDSHMSTYGLSTCCCCCCCLLVLITLYAKHCVLAASPSVAVLLCVQQPKQATKACDTEVAFSPNPLRPSVYDVRVLLLLVYGYDGCYRSSRAK